jgi:hypothetical protein
MSSASHSSPALAAVRTLAVQAACLTLVSVPAWSQVTPERSPELSGELKAVRAAREKYQDPVVAVHDGYLSTLACVEYSSGGMGVHFINMGTISPMPDPSTPQVVIYEPEGDRLRLVAAEWFIPLATGVEEHPQIFGQPFNGPMEGHQPLMPKELHHYDLHVWLWKHNPAGTFAGTNPDIRCPKGAYFFLEEPTPVVEHH